MINNIVEAMEAYNALKLPGWYRDSCGVLCIVVQGCMVSMHVEGYERFVVSVKRPDAQGKFADVIYNEAASTIPQVMALAHQVVQTLCAAQDYYPFQMALRNITVPDVSGDAGADPFDTSGSAKSQRSAGLRGMDLSGGVVL